MDKKQVRYALELAWDFLNRESQDSDRETWNIGGEGYCAISEIEAALDTITEE